MANSNCIDKEQRNAAVEDAYSRWAPIYDLVFLHILKPGRKAATRAVNAIGGTSLIIGCGTGLELPLFHPSIDLTGIDLSEPMLKIARERASREEMTNVSALLQMDATQLAFPDGKFHSVVAPYVLTCVPNPQAMLDEALRVVQPGGEIVLVNHFGAKRGPVAWIESFMGKHADTLGWDPQFRWSVLGDWVQKRSSDVELLERRKIAPFGLFTLMRLRRKQ